ncbi:MAG: hypothetical protein HS116_02690 [Planctomycetes bacterium]|nr:hypothetical protein [Planctomycetota bacterium]
MFRVPNIRKNFIPLAMSVGILHLILAGVEFEACCWARVQSRLESEWLRVRWAPDWSLGLGWYALATAYLLLVGLFALPFVYRYRHEERGDRALRLMGLAHALLALASGMEILQVTEGSVCGRESGLNSLSVYLASGWLKLSTYLWMPIAGWLLTLGALGIHVRRYFAVNRELAGILASAALSILGLVIGLGMMVSVP